MTAGPLCMSARRGRPKPMLSPKRPKTPQTAGDDLKWLHKAQLQPTPNLGGRHNLGQGVPSGDARGNAGLNPAVAVPADALPKLPLVDEVAAADGGLAASTPSAVRELSLGASSIGIARQPRDILCTLSGDLDCLMTATAQARLEGDMYAVSSRSSRTPPWPSGTPASTRPPSVNRRTPERDASDRINAIRKSVSMATSAMRLQRAATATLKQREPAQDVLRALAQQPPPESQAQFTAHPKKTVTAVTVQQGSEPQVDRPETPRKGQRPANHTPRFSQNLLNPQPKAAVVSSNRPSSKKGRRSEASGLKTRAAHAESAEETVQVKRERRLARIAVDISIPVDVCRQAAELFMENSETSLAWSKAAQSQLMTEEYDAITDGILTHFGFAKVLCKITNTADPDLLPNGLVQSCFSEADQNESSGLDFIEFALWFSRFGFSETVLLTAEQREIRCIARRHGLPIPEVERYQQTFQKYDEDGSGQIEYDEFERLLYALMRIPPHLDLPASRVRQFWANTDLDGSGSVGFEEFLVFYTRYFEVGSVSQCPFEEFYRGLRPCAIPRAW